MQSLFVVCSTIYICIYACEGPIRLFLHQHGADSLILLRDGLMFIPIMVGFVSQSLQSRVHPAYFVFLALIALHGAVIYFGQHTFIPVAYGIKLSVNLLFGFLVGWQLCRPGPKTTTLLTILWLVSIGALVVDKYLYTMPWTGLETNIGGIEVDLARDWYITGADKRAAGLMRSSIYAAALMPVLTILLACRIRRYLLRAAMLAAGLFAVFLTTQKGSLVALTAVSGALLLSNAPRRQYALLCITAAGFAVLAVGLPIFTSGLLVDINNNGTFSLSSLLLRVGKTWPEAWQWISLSQVFPFGVGLGGISGPQRFYAPDWTNPADNLFIYLYANFGVMAFLYLGWVLRQMLLPRQLQALAVVPVAILAFELGDGIVLTILEDQVATLYLGAAIGMLWQLRQMAGSGAWSNLAWAEWPGGRTALPEPISPGVVSAN